VSEPQPTLFDTLPGTDPQRVLEDVFGYRQFRPGQREIIDAVLAGRDCIGVMPTGAGKSLTFQIPARLLPGAVLVISPLISLMKDQVDALARLGFRATVLNSTVEFEERRRRLAALKRGEVELLYVAPEGLEGSLRSLIAGCSVSLVVVDEAHCISHWGHDFRPSYRRLEGLKQELGDIPVLALTATATRRVAGDIIRQLGMKKPAGFKGSFFRPNLLITAQRKGGAEGAPKRNTRRDILGLVRRHDGESGIIYCLSRRGVEGLAGWLREQGVRAAPYHAGLADEVRARHQDAFARDQIDVIVATVAFGMGIDKSNVRYVVHRDMPKSIEAWVQEIGRAGRDGLPSDCVLRGVRRRDRGPGVARGDAAQDGRSVPAGRPRRLPAPETGGLLRRDDRALRPVVRRVPRARHRGAGRAQPRRPVARARERGGGGGGPVRPRAVRAAARAAPAPRRCRGGARLHRVQ